MRWMLARTAARLGAGASVALAGGAAAQGLYLNDQYVSRKKLKPPSGPLVGMVTATSVSDGDSAAAEPSRRRWPWSFGSSVPPRRKTILFVGDSLVVGIGCRENGEPTLPRACAEHLAARLGVDVQYAAVGDVGADVHGLQALVPQVRKEVDKLGGSVDYLVVITGLNDFKRAYQSLWRGSLRRTAAGFRSELTELVTELRGITGEHTKVILPALPCHMAPVFADMWPLRQVLETVCFWYDQQKAALAEASPQRVNFVANVGLGTTDLERAEAEEFSRPVYWATDGIHPNDVGYKLWGFHIMRAAVPTRGGGMAESMGDGALFTAATRLMKCASP